MSQLIVALFEYSAGKPKVKQTIGANKIPELSNLHLICACFTAPLVLWTLIAVEVSTYNPRESLPYHLGDLNLEDPSLFVVYTSIDNR